MAAPKTFSEPGRARKQCKACEIYMHVMVKTCVCGTPFVIPNGGRSNHRSNRRSPKPKPKPAPVVDPRPPLDSEDPLDRRAWLEVQLIEVQADIDGARKSGSWQALAGIRRQALAIRQEIDELTVPEVPDEHTMTVAELVEVVATAIEGLTPEDLAPIVAALERAGVTR